MNKENLFFEIVIFMTKVKEDYKYNIISIDKYELIHIELSRLIDEIDNTDLLITLSKFHTIKTIYIIMK